MKYYIGVVSSQNTTTTPQQQYQVSDVNLVTTILTLLLGGVGAIGIPKILQSFATEKIEGVKSERRREDKIYDSLFMSMESIVKSMSEVNRTMMAGQSSSAAESFQLMATLVQEIALMREVVSNNTNVMNQIKETEEALIQEIHYMRTAGIELQEQFVALRTEINNRTIKM